MGVNAHNLNPATTTTSLQNIEREVNLGRRCHRIYFATRVYKLQFVRWLVRKTQGKCIIFQTILLDKFLPNRNYGLRF